MYNYKTNSKKAKYHLIATKIFSPNTDNTILLGEWCRNKKSDLLSHMPKYHWSDKNKLLKDIDYLRNLFEEVLNDLTDTFNNYHKKSYSKRYWRIFLGPWLAYFIHITFDRYETIKNATSEYEIEKFYDIKYKKESYITQSIEEFLYIINTDIWNQKLFSKIINYINKEKRKEIEIVYFDEIEDVKNNELLHARQFLQNKIKNKRAIFLRAYENLFKNIIKKQNHLIIDSYLGNKDELKLNLLLKQLPTFYYDELSPNINLDEQFRKKLSISFKASNEFEKFLLEIFNDYLPISFLEGYSKLEKEVEKISWPSNPKTIFTSHFLLQKTIPSLYTALKTSKNQCKLIHGQHGGAFGQLEHMWHEEHEKKISDYYLNWGWESSEKSVPIGIIKPITQFLKINKKNKNKEKLLLVTRTQPLYSNELLDTRFRSSEMVGHINECQNFISNLNSEIRKDNLILRLHAKKYGWNEYERFQSNYPEINIDKGESKITKLLLKTKLCVFTYNATGYLETFASRIPTIIFWNTKENILREETNYYFEILKKNNIFFDDPIKASKHINFIWKNIDEWWNSSNIQDAINTFCLKYSKISKNKVNEIKEILLS